MPKGLKNSLPTLSKVFFIIWFIATVAFLLGSQSKGGGTLLPEGEKYTLIYTGFIAALSFLVSAVSFLINEVYDKKNHPKSRVQNQSRYSGAFFASLLTTTLGVLLASVVLTEAIMAITDNYVAENSTASRRTGQNYTYQQSDRTTITPTPVKEDPVKGVQTTPTPTTDPDPIITCKSKTGDLRVRRSICSSYTDCPDGDGGYVFESQEDCKERMKNLGEELADLVRQWGDAYLENLKLQQELMVLEAENKVNESLSEAEEEAQESLNSVSEPNTSNESNLTIPTNTPTPAPNYEGTIVY